MLGADLLFNIGHTIAAEIFNSKVIMINAYDDIDFGTVGEEMCVIIKREKVQINIIIN